MATKAEKNFERALLELAGEDVSTALSVLTGCFVSLTLEVLRRKGLLATIRKHPEAYGVGV